MNFRMGFLLGYYAFIALILIGWWMNIYDIIVAMSEPVSGMFIARLVGLVVFPLGAILGGFF